MPKVDLQLGILEGFLSELADGRDEDWEEGTLRQINALLENHDSPGYDEAEAFLEHVESVRGERRRVIERDDCKPHKASWRHGGMRGHLSSLRTSIRNLREMFGARPPGPSSGNCTCRHF